MPYHTDPNDEDAIVFDGFQNGIADNPYDGISDMRNVNIISIPGEASVNFATEVNSPHSYTDISVTSASASDDTITFSSCPNLKTGNAIYFTVANFSGEIVTGTANAGTWYWIEVIDDTTAKLYNAPLRSGTSLINIAATGTGTFSVVSMGLPKHFTYDTQYGFTYMVDSNGRVWCNADVTNQIVGEFNFAGNKVPTARKNGNGIVYYEASDKTGFIFVFHDSSIDYVNSLFTAWSWVYQWNPSAGTVGTYNANPTAVLNTAAGTHNSHEAILAPDNRVYYCDSNWISEFYQTDTSTGGDPFDPTDTGTYTFDTRPLLPFNDIAQCLTQLGPNLMVGGKNNVIYPWDKVSTNFNGLPILLAESNIQKMVTVNTNTYAFVGNRGRIYITNGSQAVLWKKIPDHISGTVEPYFTWGGATSQKNQIYFSFYASSNQGGVLSEYGGIWAVDVDTEALRLTNKLSYGTYAGYASALIPNFSSNPAGTGLFAGWYDGVSAYGIDTTVSGTYTNSEAEIQSELIPIGTFYRPKTFKTIEYKLTAPMVTGESVSLYYRKLFSDSWTLIKTFTDVGEISGNSPVNFENAQWIQLKVVLNSI